MENRKIYVESLESVNQIMKQNNDSVKPEDFCIHPAAKIKIPMKIMKSESKPIFRDQFDIKNPVIKSFLDRVVLDWIRWWICVKI